MEALTACAVAALTVYDMVKGIERGVMIERVALLEKTGGKHDWRRASTARGAGRGDHRQHLAREGRGADECGQALAEFDSLGATSPRPRSWPTTARDRASLRHWADATAAT